MSDSDNSLKGNQVPPHVRAKILSRIYEVILSWPCPPEKTAEPTADDLGGDAATSSAEAATAVKAGTD